MPSFIIFPKITSTEIKTLHHEDEIIEFVLYRVNFTWISPLRMVSTQWNEKIDGQVEGNRGVPVVIRDNSGYTSESSLLNRLPVGGGGGGNFDTRLDNIDRFARSTRIAFSQLPILPEGPGGALYQRLITVRLIYPQPWRFDFSETAGALMRPIAILFPPRVMPYIVILENMGILLQSSIHFAGFRELRDSLDDFFNRITDFLSF